MRLTIVGCSGSYPGPESAASCYLLEAEHTSPAGSGPGETRTWRILLDLGNGALGQLHRYADPLGIDAVFVSHLHADHCLDLCGYYVMRKYHPTGPRPRIPVWGPAGTADRMARAYDLPADPGMTEEFAFHEYDGHEYDGHEHDGHEHDGHEPGAPIDLGPFRVVATRVVHPVAAFALTVTAGGRTLVYSGDTGPCPALDEAAADAHLLLAEASFQTGADNPPDLHMTGADCGRTASKAGVERLVLTHIPPWYDATVAEAEARAEWSGPIDLARPGATYEV